MNINIRLRNIAYALFALITLIFLYAVRSVLVPFIIAMVFAYIFNPLINLFNHKYHISRTISILLVYLLLIASVIVFAVLLTRAVIGESISIARNIESFVSFARHDIRYLPTWLQPTARDYLDLLSRNQLNVIAVSPFPLFSRAITGILSSFVMFFAAFFFLKDNQSMTERLVNFLPYEYRTDVGLLLKRINGALARYLRGQMLLIASMVVMLFLCLSILGVKYSLTISVASALFEIVPVMGPIFAGILGTFIVLISGGTSHFAFNPYQTVGIVIAIYYLTRQIQDYVISPYIMSRATQLHPLVVLFSVLAGQHLFGILGVLLAVPVVACCKIIYEFVIEKIREEDVVKQIRKSSKMRN